MRYMRKRSKNCKRVKSIHWLGSFSIFKSTKYSSLICTSLIIFGSITLITQISLASNTETIASDNNPTTKTLSYDHSSTGNEQPLSDRISSSAKSSIPSNHRMETSSSSAQDNLENNNNNNNAESSSNLVDNNNNNNKINRMARGHARQSRQYDSSVSASSSGNTYAALSGDGAAYVAQLPLNGPNYGGLGTTGGHSASGSSSSANYASELFGAGVGAGPGGYSSPIGPNPYLHDPLSIAARGYPIPAHSMGLPSMHHHHSQMNPPVGSPFATAFGPAAGGGGGLFSSSMFPLVSKGFDLSEIVCTAIAVAIGAVIIGAPFILIYLFVMNQMQTNGGGANGSMGPNGGAISLTGPSSSTTVNGRKKRQTGFPEALFKQLSPLVNNEQVANTFKALMSSIAKYQM